MLAPYRFLSFMPYEFSVSLICGSAPPNFSCWSSKRNCTFFFLHILFLRVFEKLFQFLVHFSLVYLLSGWFWHEQINFHIFSLYLKENILYSFIFTFFFSLVSSSPDGILNTVSHSCWALGDHCHYLFIYFTSVLGIL